MMRKIITYVLVVLAIIIMIIIVIALANPLRKSQEQITKDILKLTPIGTDIKDVVHVIETNEKWEWSGHINPNGFLKQPAPPEPRTTVGTQSIRVLIGDYRNIFVTSVTVFWGFDENSKLVDVWVWKNTDLP